MFTQSLFRPAVLMLLALGTLLVMAGSSPAFAQDPDPSPPPPTYEVDVTSAPSSIQVDQPFNVTVSVKPTGGGSPVEVPGLGSSITLGLIDGSGNVVNLSGNTTSTDDGFGNYTFSNVTITNNNFAGGNDAIQYGASGTFSANDNNDQYFEGLHDSDNVPVFTAGTDFALNFISELPRSIAADHVFNAYVEVDDANGNNTEDTTIGGNLTLDLVDSNSTAVALSVGTVISAPSGFISGQYEFSRFKIFGNNFIGGNDDIAYGMVGTLSANDSSDGIAAAQVDPTITAGADNALVVVGTESVLFADDGFKAYVEVQDVNGNNTGDNSLTNMSLSLTDLDDNIVKLGGGTPGSSSQFANGRYEFDGLEIVNNTGIDFGDGGTLTASDSIDDSEITAGTQDEDIEGGQPYSVHFSYIGTQAVSTTFFSPVAVTVTDQNNNTVADDTEVDLAFTRHGSHERDHA